MFEGLRKLILPRSESLMPITTDDLLMTAPDGWKLEQYMRQLIFVPDQMKKGGRDHGLLVEGSWTHEPLHPTAYTAEKFTFWKKDLGVASFPIVLPESYRPSGFIRDEVVPAQIKGELWAVRGHHIAKVLDNHMGFGVRYIRERIPIRYPYVEVGWHGRNGIPKLSDHYFTTVTAWMYIGLTEYWDPQIGGVFSTTQMERRLHDDPQPYVGEFYKFDI